MSRFTDRLWSDLVREHGGTLAHTERPERARVPRPRVLAGGTLALAGGGAVLALVLSATAGPPAYAVTRHHDGSVSVQINRRSGVDDANRELAAMGVRERVMAVSDNAPLPLNCVAHGPGPDGRSLVIKGYPTVSTGPVSKPSSTPGRTGARRTPPGAPRVGSTWHVVACSSAGRGGG
ncbi:MAG TPA: hypothetical protein VGL93_23515 [Streptosporangiaceae bacterium]|jgi:hypothetical protein